MNGSLNKKLQLANLVMEEGGGLNAFGFLGSQKLNKYTYTYIVNP